MSPPCKNTRLAVIASIQCFLWAEGFALRAVGLYTPAMDGVEGIFFVHTVYYLALMACGDLSIK